MEAPGRFELPTCGLGNRCSIHLSYGALFPHVLYFSLQWAALGVVNCVSQRSLRDTLSTK